MRDLQDIQADINMMDQAIQGGGSIDNLDTWKVEKEKYEREFVDATAYWEKLEITATQVGYSIDNVTFEGLTIAEIITDDTQFKLIRNGFQELMVHQAEAHDTNTEELKAEIDKLNEHIHAHELEHERLQTANTELEVKNYELGLQNDELSEKVKKVAEMQHEADQQIAQQKQHIDELQKQLALGVRGALNVVDVPQDTSKMAAEIIARKVRITNVRFKDENGIDTRIKQADNVLTGDPVEYEAIYEKRYIILNTEEAEQYRIEEAAKKAEIEAQQAAIPTLEVPEIPPVNNVLEEEATTEEQPFQEEVQAAGSELVDQSLSLSGEEESEVTYVTQRDHQLSLETVFVTIHQLSNRVLQLEANVHPMAS